VPARLAAAFTAAGLGPGPKIAIDLYNCTECWRASTRRSRFAPPPANINYRYLDRELVHILTTATPKASCSTPSFGERILGLRRSFRKSDYTYRCMAAEEAQGSADGVAEYEDLIAAHAPAQRIGRLVR